MGIFSDPDPAREAQEKSQGIYADDPKHPGYVPAAEDVWSHEQYVRLESLTQAVAHSHGRGTQWDVIRVANDFANYVNHGEGVEGVTPNAEA